MVTILPAQFPEDRALVETLFREYQQSIGIDLDFQSFDEEIAALPGKYAPPRGNIVIAQAEGKVAGSVAWYPLTEVICEVKRLYVRPGFRGQRIGFMLLNHAIEESRKARYRAVRLDSLARLKEARKLYESFAFQEIAPYNANPFSDVYYMELELL
jgi:GNAT superfamily N-acetyltransferase